ncbi:DUF262 domain-containing protein [Undibacterium sp. SXout7W]|uniref:DUF262 domain-containing protein n=1 Tax=Undibacterium sp. SXout7W TaxID=3413049 RepID=UPI003BF44159
MKIEANDKEIQDIFSLGYFQIPRFQRPYSWERDEVEKFWNDVVNDNAENYFIGSMVVYQAKKPYFGIVDGQQRLTTITLILAAIRNSFISIGETNLAKGVHQYIEKPNIDNQEEFVLNAETSYPYLQDHIQNFIGTGVDWDVGVEELNLKTAFELINHKLSLLAPVAMISPSSQADLAFDFTDETVQKLKALRDKVLSLKLVFIQLDNEDDAYLIFETLNARGRDLKSSDLVKNLLLKKIKAANIKLDSAKESWNLLIKRFDDINGAETLDVFLLHYWLSAHGYTTDQKLFSEISVYVSVKEGNAELLMKRLNEVAPIYCRALDPENATWTKEEAEVKQSLLVLNSFKVKQQSSMVLALLRAYYDKKLSLKNLKTTLKKIEFFHFVFNAVTSQRSSGSIATMYSTFAIKLSDSNGNDEIQSILNGLFSMLASKLPSYEEFEVKFLTLTYLANRTKHKNVIKYSLSRQLGEQINGLKINLDNLTIEHLLPESFIKKGTSEDVVGNIGNLLLVESKTNSDRLKDKEPSEKIKFLKEINYPVKKALVNNSEWSELEIRERSKEIAKVLYQLVKIG